ncbi:hypothetical protein BRC81_06865 [Halobacteriales archaeon QS_1_68_20]|nr:MAG: hypothetical protein BRC81_06865 [Halobacteriales archaeon QS_1_68_20]
MTDASERWTDDRTTFQRVYDVLVGTREYLPAEAFADRASCSETAARQALQQLSEMGIAERRDERPARFRPNESYFTWRRVERLASEHSPEELRQRVAELIDEDETYQEKYGVQDPSAVTSEDLPVDDQDAIQQRWSDLGEWRAIRRDIRVVRRAVRRAETNADERGVA